jgi:hypothetical protein
MLSRMRLILSLGVVVYKPDSENTTFIPPQIPHVLSRRRYKFDLTIKACDFIEAYRIVTA